MKFDLEGFAYPHIEENLCVHCNCCEKVCPVVTKLKVQNDNRELQAFAALNTNGDIRYKSSSGGVFSLLAEKIIKNGGVVFGAAFQSDFSLKHIWVDNVDDLDKLRGSKYVQSVIGDSFKTAKDFLDRGRYVLFTGTPCQIEGLISFLGKDYDNLFTQDIICHGVPSPLVWKKYLDFQKKEFKSNIVKVNFRDKSHGWDNYAVSIDFENGKKYFCEHSQDLYMKAFIKNWSLRPSCYNCHFKKKNRVSDITLADFWGIEKVKPNLNDDKGISLVIVHSKKGREIFEEIAPSVNAERVKFDDAIIDNPAMIKSMMPNEKREMFFRYIKKNSFLKSYYKCDEKNYFKDYFLPKYWENFKIKAGLLIKKFLLK